MRLASIDSLQSLSSSILTLCSYPQRATRPLSTKSKQRVSTYPFAKSKLSTAVEGVSDTEANVQVRPAKEWQAASGRAGLQDLRIISACEPHKAGPEYGDDHNRVSAYKLASFVNLGAPVMVRRIILCKSLLSISRCLLWLVFLHILHVALLTGKRAISKAFMKSTPSR